MDVWKPVGGDGAGHDEVGERPRWVGQDPSRRFPIYTRGNAGEVYPQVFTPLSYSVASEAGEQAMRNVMLGTGLIRPGELEDLPLTTAVGAGVFGGYAYLNLSIQRLIAARSLGGKATDADVNVLGVGEPPPHQPLPDERNLVATLAGLRYAWRTTRRRELPELEDDRRLVDAYLAGLADPATATDDQLRQSVDQLMPMFADLFERHLAVSFAAGVMVSVLTGMCDRQLGEPNLAVQLLAGLGDVDSAAPSQAMWQLARSVDQSPPVAALFDQGVPGLARRLAEAATDDPAVARFDERLAGFLAAHGSRGPNEWDTAFDTWETAPDLALAAIDRMRGVDPSHEPARRQRELAADAAGAEAEAVARLPRPLRPLFGRVLAAARLYSRGRERTKTTVVRAIHGARLQSQELDRRLAERGGGERGDLWFLLDDELDDYVADPGSFGARIDERRRTHRLLSERVPPFFFSGHQPPLEEWELRTATREPLSPGETLTGLPGCPGVARGTARVVTDPADPRGLRPGDVLVAPLTDPAWTPLFVPAEAVVVDVGAVMSHAVIVSRELGIPCVVSATDATKRLRDGATIEVDGSAGTVTVID